MLILINADASMTKSGRRLQLGPGIKLSETTDGGMKIDTQPQPFVNGGTTTSFTPDYTTTSATKCVMGSGTTTINAPTGTTDAGTYVLFIRNNSGGTGVLSWNSAYLFPGGSDPVIPLTANCLMVVTMIVEGSSVCAVAVSSFA